MKKSEMIEILKRDLYGLNIHSENAAYEVAKQILNTIEDWGMVPPKAWIITNPDNPNYPELKNEKEYIRNWEEE